MQMAPPNPSDTGLMSPSQMSLACILRNAASDNDVVATAGGAVDTGSEEDAYVAFRNWISASPDRMKPELAQLLYPVFTHLYLQLVLRSSKTEVHALKMRLRVSVSRLVFLWCELFGDCSSYF